MPFQPHWRIVPGSRFRWREWDGEFVLYHENSGDTHRLNPLGARAVRLLLASAASARELTGRIAAESPMDGNATPRVGPEPQPDARAPEGSLARALRRYSTPRFAVHPDARVAPDSGWLGSALLLGQVRGAPVLGYAAAAEVPPKVAV